MGFEAPPTMPKKKNYYEVLGVPQNADAETLKHAYKELAKKYHPDLNPNDKIAEENFKRLIEAYNILSDPQKRTVYNERFKPENLSSNMPVPKSFGEIIKEGSERTAKVHQDMDRIAQESRETMDRIARESKATMDRIFEETTKK